MTVDSGKCSIFEHFPLFVVLIFPSSAVSLFPTVRCSNISVFCCIFISAVRCSNISVFCCIFVSAVRCSNISVFCCIFCFPLFVVLIFPSSAVSLFPVVCCSNIFRCRCFRGFEIIEDYGIIILIFCAQKAGALR